MDQVEIRWNVGCGEGLVTVAISYLRSLGILINSCKPEGIEMAGT